jgi:hypothetical protein
MYTTDVTMSTIPVLKGKKLEKDIKSLAKEMNLDLSKADTKKTKVYLKKVPSLSKIIIRNRKR